jgi:hypothetical protein
MVEFYATAVEMVLLAIVGVCREAGSEAQS